ncbi:hypothetical protein GCM10010387_37730 [Streptomyces inusitatus]|uniref:Uncharacterized protein n=1 Tax=Streptomyces inusitatus TaxID=68221 RepID=A0A918UXF1_9ACTN|nr:hypothetical protein [Streptomyces inusitatus]GGZ39823.1 hypothetical protein GCM10010387_37730 [Streptomyces inusitatus]
MAEALIDFVYATMRKRADDPDSPYWLPKILEGIRTPDGRTLSPLKADSWELGELAGDTGTTVADSIAVAWWNFVGKAFDRAKKDGVGGLPESLDDFDSQRDRDDQYPGLTLSGVSVTGLPNASVGELTDVTTTENGYRGTVRITTAAYDSHGYQPQITVDGSYRLVQHVVVIDDPESAPDAPEVLAGTLRPPTAVPADGLKAYGVGWPSQTIEGSGAFLFTVKGLVLDVRLTVETAGSGSGRTEKVTVESVSVAAAPVFALDEDKLTIDGDTITDLNRKAWKGAAVLAFDSPDAAEALTAKLADALNAEDFRTQFSGSVTDQLTKALGDVLGTGPLPADSGRPPAGDGPVEVYLFDRVRASLNDPDSGFYPPTVVRSSSDPALDPLSIDTIDLGEHQVMGVPVDFTLNEVTIRGISDVLVPAEDAALVAEGVDATLRFGRISQTPITVAASVVATFVKSGDHLDGTMTTTVRQPSAALGLSFSGPDADSLTIGLRSLTVDIDPDKLDIGVHVEGLPDEAVHTILNTSDIKDGFIKGVQDGAERRKDDIAKALTDNARKVIAKKLSG